MLGLWKKRTSVIIKIYNIRVIFIESNKPIIKEIIYIIRLKNKKIKNMFIKNTMMAWLS